MAVNLTVDNFIDYYELLHVQPKAPAPVIKASYRAMMQKLNHHPDRGGDVGFAQLLNDAAKTLCDPDTRAQYDILRRQQQQTSVKSSKTTRKTAKKPSAGWGEPGGTPGDFNSNRDNPADGNAEREHDTASRDSESGQNTTHSSAIATYNTALSAKSHCLFCQAPYAPPNASPYSSTGTGYSHSARCRICNGARTPIEQQPRSSNDELRSMHRQNHNSNVKLWRQWPVTKVDTVPLYDFSPEGCSFLYENALGSRQIVMLESHLFNAICAVRHCEPKDASFIIGLEYLTLDMLAPPGALLNATA